MPFRRMTIWDRFATAQDVLADRTNFSTNCVNDLASISAQRSDMVRYELTTNTLIDAASGAQILNGVGSSDPLSSLYPAPASSLVSGTIGQQFADNPKGLTALSQLGTNSAYGTLIYVNPDLINGSIPYIQGLLLHEGLHLLGFDDADLQRGLGLPVDPKNTGSTTRKLEKDCVTGKGNS